jgi:hypothetical protein
MAPDSGLFQPCSVSMSMVACMIGLPSRSKKAGSLTST